MREAGGPRARVGSRTFGRSQPGACGAHSPARARAHRGLRPPRDARTAPLFGRRRPHVGKGASLAQNESHWRASRRVPTLRAHREGKSITRQDHRASAHRAACASRHSLRERRTPKRSLGCTTVRAQSAPTRRSTGLRVGSRPRRRERARTGERRPRYSARPSSKASAAKRALLPRVAEAERRSFAPAAAARWPAAPA